MDLTLKTSSILDYVKEAIHHNKRTIYKMHKKTIECVLLVLNRLVPIDIAKEITSIFVRFYEFDIVSINHKAGGFENRDEDNLNIKIINKSFYFANLVIKKQNLLKQKIKSHNDIFIMQCGYNMQKFISEYKKYITQINPRYIIISEHVSVLHFHALQFQGHFLGDLGYKLIKHSSTPMLSGLNNYVIMLGK